MPGPADWLRAAVYTAKAYTPGEQPPPGDPVIKLNTNENPYPPSARVVEALARALDGSLRLYPDPEASALRARAAEVYGVGADHILAGNGSDELLALILRAAVDPGQKVAFPVPTYSLYETLVAVHGAVAVKVPFPDDWAIPGALATTGARVTFLCNPNSPTGTAVPIGAVEELAATLRGILVVDEAYVDFADADALDLVRRRVTNVIVLRTLSKSFSLAGLRIGLAFGMPELLAHLRKVKDSYNLNRLSQLAGEAALADVATMRENVARVRATRGHLVKGLARLGYEVLPSQANFVLARRPGVDQAAVADGLAEANIFVRHFPIDGLRDALRITVGTDREIAALLDAIARS